MSFSRVPVSDQCKDERNTSTTTIETQNKMSKPQKVFDSEDFGNFLSKMVPKEFLAAPTSLFLSKDSSLPPIDDSIFKSKEAFSNVFSSRDWEMKFPIEEAPKTAALPPLKTMYTVPVPPIPAPVALPLADKSVVPAVFASEDWLPGGTLGDHVDVPISSDMFNASDTEEQTTMMGHDLPSGPPPSLKTEWDKFFTNLQLALPPPSSPAEDALSEEQILPDLPEDIISPQELPSSEQVAVHAPVASAPVANGSIKPRKKRKRAPRKKPIPAVKEYVSNPKDSDVLLGRGGKSNHHPGNKRYREEVKNLQKWYSEEEDKNKKTDLSQMLVDYVIHNLKGRFLEKEKETDKWYVAPNITARRKASQALREDNDAEKRKAKRMRFLEKKAQKEQMEEAATQLVAGV